MNQITINKKSLTFNPFSLGRSRTNVILEELNFLKMNRIQLDNALIYACQYNHIEVVQYLLSSSNLTEHADIHTNNDWGLISACEKGNLEIVRYLLASSNLKQHADIHAQGDESLLVACQEGHLDIVKYLLTSPELKEHADIHADNDDALRFACLYGHLDIVSYLLTSSELKEHADIHANNDNALRLACINGHLDIVKYLLTSSDLKEHADIHAYDEDALQYACRNGHSDIVKYLLTSPELKEHACIHAQNDFALRIACRNEYLEVVKCLLENCTIMNYNLINEILMESNHIRIFSCVYEFFLQCDFLKHARQYKKNNWMYYIDLLSKWYCRLMVVHFDRNYNVNINNIEQLNEYILIRASHNGNIERIKYIISNYEINSRLFKLMKKIANKDIIDWLDNFFNCKKLYNNLNNKLSTSKPPAKIKINKI